MELTQRQQSIMGAIYNGIDTHEALVHGLEGLKRRVMDLTLAHLVGEGLLYANGGTDARFELTLFGHRKLVGATAPFATAA